MQTIDAPATDGLVTLSHVPVAILRWPEEVDRETALAETGALRLLLIPPSVTPPTDWDPAMDWIRLPADDEDIWRRVAGLQRRVRRLPAPRLDEYGVLWRDPSWVSLAPIEARIFALLLERPGVVCGRTRLMRSAWPNAPVSEHSLNAYIKRLRKRIEPLRLAINTVRRRGYFLEIDPPVAA